MAPPPARPKRADVVAAYDRGVEAYETLWSPVILPPAESVVEAMALHDDEQVLDVGAGTGALVGSIRSAAPNARVIALDPSMEMLRVAMKEARVPSVLADALALPVTDGSADAVLLAYVLFHLADPALGVAEAARVLRMGGRVATVTWAKERAANADAVWNKLLEEAGAPPAPLRRLDTGLDSADGIASLLSGAGLSSASVWLEALSHRWTAETFCGLASGSGVNRGRLAHLEPAVRHEVLARLREQLDHLAPEDFDFSGEVVCAVATKTG